MALTASSIITSAKQRTYGKRGRQKISDAGLLDALAGQDLVISQVVSQINADLLTVIEEEDSITLSENQNGYDLQDGMHYRNFTHADEADDVYREIRIIRRHDRDKRPAPPAAILQGTASGAKLYPVDPSGEHWQGSSQTNWFSEDSGHKFTYSYVPTPGTLSALSDTLTTPEWGREVLIVSLELSILQQVDTSEMGQAQLSGHEQALAQTMQRHEGVVEAFEMQLYKFAHPQGLDSLSEAPESDTAWVNSQVGG